MFYGLGVVLVRILFLFPVLGDSITVIDQYVAADTVILPVNALGLANRLRIMASAYSIAVRANRSLTVVWQRNEDCMAPFTDLYLMPTGINVVDWDELSDNAAFSTSVRRAIRSSAAEKGLTVAEGYPRNFIYGLDDTSRGMVSILWTRGTHAPSAADCNGYLADKVQFYQHLHLVPAVEQLIQSIELRWGQGRLVGVHIRAFDERYDWAVVSPSLTRAGAAATTTSGSEHNHKWSVDLRSKRFDQAVSLDAFVGLMTDLLAAEPSVRFFVASNSAQAKNRIVRHFGAERVLTLDENARLGERESAHSIVVAAAEFHLLGMTDLVVHTRGSSFAREAAARTGIPVIDVSMEEVPLPPPPPAASLHSHVLGPEGEPFLAELHPGDVQVVAIRPLSFLSQHSAVAGGPPLCSMPEYMRAARTFQEAASAGTAREPGFNPLVCYVEDGREMCTVAYSVCPCASAAPLLLGGLRYEALHCYVPESELGSRTDCVRLLAESNGYTMTL